MRIFHILVLLALLTACEKNETGPRPAPGDYFPTAVGLRWHYLVTYPGSTSTGVPVQTIAGDTLVGNQTYTKVRTAFNYSANPADSSFAYSLVRKDNGNYLELIITELTSAPTQTLERVFLKDYAREGAQWTYTRTSPTDPESLETILFKITAVDQERKINGMKYLNTIEVQENTYLKSFKNNNERLFISRHAIYAKDQGLVHETTEYFDYPTYWEKALKMGPF